MLHPVPAVKKSVVILLIVIALVVLITPGIVGRLAEQSMDQNLEIAVTESEDVVISSEGFVHGWFTSEGQHRIELIDYLGLAEDDFAPDQPHPAALLVDTRIDHGLIPVTSMAREKGSLAPGLGSAISTLSLEFSDGTARPLPGKIYSELGLTGALQSNLVVEADAVNLDGGIIDWGDSDITVTADAASGAVAVKGSIDSLSLTSPAQTVRVSSLALDIDQQPGPFGYELGHMNVSIDFVGIQSSGDDITMGPMALTSALDASGDRVSGDATFKLANFQSPFGAAEINVAARLDGADGKAMAKVMRTYESLQELGRGENPQIDPLDGFLDLLAGGMELHIDRLDLALPQGTMTARMDLMVEEGDADNFTPAAALLALDGTLDLKVSQGLVDFATSLDKSLGAIVGLGYLRKNGDEYETFVEIRSGVLTINGAPMQIPLSAFQ